MVASNALTDRLANAQPTTNAAQAMALTGARSAGQ